MIGFDYTARIAPATLKAAGCAVAIRYVMPQTPFWVKTLRNPEAEELLAAGIPIVSNWETTADRMAAGASAGRDDAVQLLANWHALGAPSGLIGWFSADWDVQASEVPAVLAYLNAAAAVLGGKKYVGCYGGLRAVAAAMDAGFGGWQTIAWSGGVWDSRAAARQTGEQRVVGGVQVDVNQIIDLAALGAWGGPTTGEDVALTADEIQAIAAAVNNYRDTNNTVKVDGKPYAASAYELAIGTWKAAKDPAGGLEQMRGQINDMFHRPAFQPVDVTALAAAIGQLPAGATADAIAQAVVAHLGLEVVAK